MKNIKTVVISLGGSIVISKSGSPNSGFIRKFRDMVLRLIKKGFRFIIVVGGGKICRTYQSVASRIAKPSFEDMDWLGISATRLNAQLIKAIFKDKACGVVTNPRQPIAVMKPVIIAAGWKPGWSTDYDAVLLASRFGVKEIINASNIPFIFDEDPEVSRLNRSEPSPIEKMSWQSYRKIAGSRWLPGLRLPIDPIAAKEAQKRKIRAIITLGTDLKNLEKVILGKKFKGTVIR